MNSGDRDLSRENVRVYGHLPVLREGCWEGPDEYSGDCRSCSSWGARGSREWKARCIVESPPTPQLPFPSLGRTPANTTRIHLGPLQASALQSLLRQIWALGSFPNPHPNLEILTLGSS